MSAGGKIKPRSVDLHAIATNVAAFLVPITELHNVKGGPGLADKIRAGDHPSGLVIGLNVQAETAEGERQFGLVLGPFVDPCELAGELEGLATTIVARAAIDLGFDSIEAAQRARRSVREHRLASRREVEKEVPANVTCDFCPRSLAFVIDGQRYCKRCAEEAGVRPHGKIGGES